MFNKACELEKLCRENNKKIYEIVIEKELEESDISYEELMDRMKTILRYYEKISKFCLK